MSARLVGVVLALALCTLAACGDGGSADGSGTPGDLTGRQWVLDTEALGVGGAGSVGSFIRFDAAQVVGNDGCNQFSGSYEVDGSRLELGPLATTQMACPGAADEVARRVTSALDGVESYAVSGGTLELQDASGDAVLTYRERTPGVEGAWEVTSVLYDDGIRSVIAGTRLTAAFGAGRRVSGSAGCNTFRGPYEADGGRLRVGPLAATRKACREPEGIAEQERGYLAALASVVRFEQVADRLTLFNAKSQMAVTLERSG